MNSVRPRAGRWRAALIGARIKDMRDRRLLFALVAAAFLAAAFIASRCSDAALDDRTADAKALDDRAKIVFPRDEARRKRPRATSPLDTTKPVDDAKPPPPRDGLQRAIAGEGALFAEVNAIRHSDLVEKMMRCRGEEAMGQFAVMKDELGIDPSQDLDRVGFDDKVFAASGFFENLKVPEQLGAGEPYGDKARVWKMPPSEQGGEPGYAARVGNDLVVMGETEAEVRAAVDRVEGRAPPRAAIDESLAKSEIYGPLSQELIQSFLKDANDPVAQRLMDSIAGGALRMNVDEHVKISLDLRPKDAATGEDLSKAVGGAFAMMRKQAEASGDPELAWLLEQARVLPQDDGKFGIDLAVPGSFILDKMGCDEQGARKAGLPANRPAPAAPPPPAPAPTP
jgi:hypothetical protein